MKFLKLIFLLLCITSLVISCNKEPSKVTETTTKKSTTKKEIAAKFKKTEFNIKGMTCEIGCARLIQSKLSKVDGVKFVKISFKDSLGMINYDSNKLSFKKIETMVNNIAGGDLYTITNHKDVSEFRKFKK
jgi:Cu+-exporting ATPase